MTTACLRLALMLGSVSRVRRSTDYNKVYLVLMGE